jgi:Gpi18-like mannosyltransferase
VGLSLLALAAVALLPNAANVPGGAEAGLPGPVDVPGWPAPQPGPGWHNLFTAWERFDALWFLRIAEEGYRARDGSAAFFPLYPLTVRVLSGVLGGHPFAAALLLSSGALVAALVLLYLLTAHELDEEAARRAVLYTCLFPGAVFLFAPYSEPLFLLCSVGAFLAARRGRWAVAGAAGALAAATRSVGILLGPALAVEALTRRREGERAWPGLLAAAAVPLGTLAYLGWWGLAWGDPLAPLRQQATWQRSAAAPWETALQATRQAFRWIGTYPGGYHLLDWLLVVPVAAACVYAAFRFRPAYAVYALASLLVPLAYAFPPRPLMSVPRFAAVLFPVSWVLADLTRRRILPHAGVVAVSAGGLAISTLLFAGWYYIF